MVVVVASLASSSSRSLLSSSSKVGVFQRRRRRHHKIDRNSIIASVSRSWTSRTSVSVPLRDHLDPNNEDTNYSKKSSFSEYISDGSRILAVTFPDETRREQMTDTTWKVQVLNCVYYGIIRIPSMQCLSRLPVDERSETHTHARVIEATLCR